MCNTTFWENYTLLTALKNIIKHYKYITNEQYFKTT